MNRYKIPGFDGGYGVSARDIIRVEALSNYSRIYFANGKIATVAKVLHWFEDELPKEFFVRVHKSHLVNTGFVFAISGKRKKSLILQNGDSVFISRRKQTQFLASYKNIFETVYQ